MTNDSTLATRPAPPVGRLQQLDGRRVFVHRTGSGGPAVVVLPGAGAVGLDYLLVQQQASRFTTTIVYDRGGTGYSDPVPLPRSAADVAAELHGLLHAEGIAAPYVLVAHSLGGAYAHRFAQLYPLEVAGLVLLDAFHRDWDDFMPAEVGLTAGESMTPELEQLQRMRPDLRAMYTELMVNYPEQVREPLVEAHVSDRWLRATIAERATLVALAAELRAGPGFPDVPLIALSTEGTDPAQRMLTSERAVRKMSEQTLQETVDGRKKMLAALVDAVSDGEQRVLADVGHTQLYFQRPGAVVQAIREIVDRAARA